MNAADKTQRIPNTTFEIRRVSDGGLVETVTTGTDGRVYVPLESGSYKSRFLIYTTFVVICQAPDLTENCRGSYPLRRILSGVKKLKKGLDSRPSLCYTLHCSERESLEPMGV